MPLTFSHPAIILPVNWLCKRLTSLTGLVAGSVAPDFECFFRMRVMSIYSHTWLGLLWFDVPVALLICFTYHNLVRRMLIQNLPINLYQRLEQLNHFEWNTYFKKNVIIVILSAIIGIASHLFWDSFTHLAGYFVQRWQMFVSVHLFHFEVPLYKIVQHASTLTGGIVIIFAVYNIPHKTLIINNISWVYWAIIFLVVFSIILVRLITGLDIHQYWNILVTAISGVILGFIWAPVFIKLR